MSELKVHKIGDLCFDFKMGKDVGIDFYLKSEADKVIAELKQKINELQTELELWRDGSIISEAHQKELDEKRHSDYNRCLDIAEWCSYKAKVFNQYARHTDYIPNVEKYKRKRDHYANRCNNLLLLAEKFKEAK